jgi:pyruvate formate lyase activating enzyme
VSNREILKNIRRAAQKNKLILRSPLIPGFNDSTNNISESAKFAKELGNNIVRLELLPYHLFGIHKYEELEREYAIKSIQPPSEENIAILQDIAQSFGIEVKIGG